MLVVVFACGWLAAAGWGMWRLAEYSSAPGAEGVAPVDWPTASAVPRDAGRFTAVLALHPECPCSQATVEELDALVAQVGPGLKVHALFVEVPGLPGPVESSELWQRTGRIAGVELRKDPAGADARRFGARTSGETRLYDPAGRLVFQGGITLARGHAGDNPGRTAITNFVARRTSGDAPVRTPVFGCALWNESTRPTP
jgi:hypothetical protein